MERLSSSRWQGLISALVGAVTAILVGVALLLTMSAVAPMTYVGIFLGTSMAVSMMYVPLLVTAITGQLRKDAVQIYPLDPHYSLLVRASALVARRLGLAAAALATVGALGPFLVPGLGALSLVLAVLGFIGWLGVVGTQFVLQQYNLSRIVSQRRARTLDELQEELSVYYERRASLDEGEMARFESLLSLHDRVAGTDKTASDFRDIIQFMLPLLLPLLSLLIGSSRLPLLSDNVLGWIQDLLGP